jgi:hypothetical protein
LIGSVKMDRTRAREHFAHFDAMLAVALEGIGGTDAEERGLAGSHAGDALSLANAGRQFFAGHFRELRFWIEQIEMRGCAGLEEINYAFCSGGKVQSMESARFCCRGLFRTGVPAQ